MQGVSLENKNKMFIFVYSLILKQLDHCRLFNYSLFIFISFAADQKSMLNKNLENFLQYSNIKPTPASVSEEDSSPKDQTSSKQNSLMLRE